MIINKHQFDFCNCPTCKGLAIWLNDNLLNPVEANRLQAVELVSHIDTDPDCIRLNIKVSRKERKRCKAALRD